MLLRLMECPPVQPTMKFILKAQKKKDGLSSVVLLGSPEKNSPQGSPHGAESPNDKKIDNSLASTQQVNNKTSAGTSNASDIVGTDVREHVPISPPPLPEALVQTPTEDRQDRQGMSSSCLSSAPSFSLPVFLHNSLLFSPATC